MQHLPSRQRHINPFDLDSAEIAIFEQIADEPSRTGSDDDRIRLGQALQPRSQVWRLSDDRLLLRRAFADQIADHHQPGRDPDPGLQCDGFAIEPTDRNDDAEARTDRPLGIVLMRPWVAEISQDSVAHVFCDKAVEPADDLSDGAMIGGDDLAQILGV
jgi:hypothetical protein